MKIGSMFAGVGALVLVTGTFALAVRYDVLPRRKGIILAR
jgi:hypothetical protein